jgi:hypothetical protein
MINQKCVDAGSVLLQWGIISEEVLAAALIQLMKSDVSLLKLLLNEGHITVYQQLFVLMEQSSRGLSEVSNVAGCYSSLPTMKQA